MNGTPWTDVAPELVNLAISQYTPQPGRTFSAHDLLHPLLAIGTLEMLSIANFTFDSDYRYKGWGGYAGLIHLGIEDCHNSEDIAEILRILGGVHMVTFTRCDVEPSFGTFWNFDISSISILTLRELGDQDLVPLLGLWNGDRLWVEDCPSFDDSILAAMRTRKNGRFLCTPRLKSLGIEISATSNATFSAALKRFVATRLEERHRDGKRWRKVVSPDMMFGECLPDFPCTSWWESGNILDNENAMRIEWVPRVVLASQDR